MNIRPKKILKFLNGTYNDWYNDFRKSDYFKWFNEQLYNPEARTLNGTPLKRNLSNWSIGGPTHHVTDDLAARAYSNLQYTNVKNYSNITKDILNVADLWKDKNYTPELFRDLYNWGIINMHDYQSRPHTYTGLNDNETAEFNRRYNLYYKSKGTNNSQSGILYNQKLEGIYGTQTLQRDVDLYLKKFSDLLDYEKQNRIHKINLNGKDVYYYKEYDGTILLLPEGTPNVDLIIQDSKQALDLIIQDSKQALNNPPSQTTSTDIFDFGNDPFGINGPSTIKPKLTMGIIPTFNIKPTESTTETGGSVETEHDDTKKNKSEFWSTLGNGLKLLLPNIIAAGRLAGNIWNNNKVAEETLKGLRPDLKLTYYTYSQVKGDEAGRLQYYNKGAQGETRAKRAITSNMDTQLAYQNEMKANADLLRLQGDLLDNQEIRRTSEMSDLHRYANTQRATEIANYNTAALNAYNKAVHDVKAGQQSANWTSIDNALLTWEERIREKAAQREQMAQQAKLLQWQNDLDNDETLIEYNKKWNDAYWKNDYAKMSEISKKRNHYIRQKQIEYYTSYAKSGTKLTYKHKDDLLYKTTKDAADHYRKMVKLTSDSNNRKRIKIEKLTSHPKGHTKKYLLGGVAPFTIWRPATSGGSRTTSSEISTSSTGSNSKSGSEKNEMLDMVKELFKQVAGKGLPSDVNTVYTSMRKFLAQAEYFGNLMSTSDIASMYLQQMEYINSLNFFKDAYDKAKAEATQNDALNEYAITSSGRYVVQNPESGKIEQVDLKELKSGKYIPLTNNQLLQMRAIAPSMAFDLSGILDVVSNGIGMSKVAAHIKDIIPAIKSNQMKEDNYVSNKLNQGIKALLEAPEGEYKHTITLKSNLEQAKFALNYIEGILPKNMRAVLEANAAEKGVTAHDLIASLISSETEVNLSSEYTAVTGRGAKNSNGNSKDGLEINSAVQLLLGMSSPRQFTFNIGNGNTFTGSARVSSINDTNETPFGADFSYSEIYKSSLRKNLDLDNASFGDVPINKALKNQIIVDNSTIAGVDLPYTVDRNGRIIPDFDMLNRIEEADKEVMKQGINPDLEPQRVNEIYAKHGLPIKYGADNRLSGNYKRFAVIQATAIEDVFLNKDGLASNGTLTLVSDENEIDKYLEELKKTTGKKKIDIDRPGLFTGDKDIYKGSIFIPIIGDLTDAISGSKTGKLTENNYDTYRNEWNTRNYVKPPQYIKP